MKGKLIVIEGTDCSGKETQSKLLTQKLTETGKKVARISFPMYDTPSGRIIGSCLIGKPHMCQDFLKTDHGFFKEGGGNVDSLAAICYYAADRRYNLPLIKKYLEENDYLIIDRYTTSNMAHRGGMIGDSKKRQEIYQKIALLEYEILELPKPDTVIFLYMPYEYACILKKNRTELPDETENNIEYLKQGEKAYLELAELYNFERIDCVSNNIIKTPEEISEEVYQVVRNRK